MDDVKIIGILGAGVSLQVVNSLVAGLLPILSALVLLSQVAVGVATVILLWRKVRKQKGSKPDSTEV